MIESLPNLAFLTLSYAHHHGGGGMTDWIAHMAISSVIHAVIYGFVFRLMAHLTLQQDAVLVAAVLGVVFVWARSRDRRGW
ncbi:MAG: hypothetical protein ACRYG6_07575 [Janthinobacterium lividum]